MHQCNNDAQQASQIFNRDIKSGHLLPSLTAEQILLIPLFWSCSGFSQSVEKHLLMAIQFEKLTVYVVGGKGTCASLVLLHDWFGDSLFDLSAVEWLAGEYVRVLTVNLDD